MRMDKESNSDSSEADELFNMINDRKYERVKSMYQRTRNVSFSQTAEQKTRMRNSFKGSRPNFLQIEESPKNEALRIVKYSDDGE